jgi:hypothetical protein
MPDLRTLPRLDFTLVLGLAIGLAGCPVGGNGDDDDDDGVSILGNGTHDIANMVFEVMADDGDGLNTPRDLAFHPQRTDELWIVNRADNSSVILLDAGTDDQEANRRGNTAGSAHFLAQPSALAFADDGTWASIHETDDLTQGPGGTPEDFMGPTLWTDDLDIYDGGHGGHLDMLHNSPNGMGIAWEEDRTFWVFDGFHDSLTRYFFNDDHGPGGADHSDGEIERHVEGEVRWREDIPSHMEYDHNEDYLYIADTGNNRIAVHDARSGDEGGSYGPNYDGIGRQVAYEGGDCWTLVDGESIEDMGRPSGLALHNDMIFTNDNRSGRIFAFDLDGNLLDWLDTGLEEGALMGMEFDADGNLWLVDAVNDEVLRISVGS